MNCKAAIKAMVESGMPLVRVLAGLNGLAMAAIGTARFDHEDDAELGAVARALAVEVDDITSRLAARGLFNAP